MSICISTNNYVRSKGSLTNLRQLILLLCKCQKEGDYDIELSDFRYFFGILLFVALISTLCDVWIKKFNINDGKTKLYFALCKAYF